LRLTDLGRLSYRAPSRTHLVVYWLCEVVNVVASMACLCEQCHVRQDKSRRGHQCRTSDPEVFHFWLAC
jgi:hypothetical protein